MALVLLAPVFALCALVIKLSSPGPVFFTQHRGGRGGRVFRIVKFRSMVVGAEHAGPGITISGDPRVTPFGGLLRRLKLDELPQLLNVLRGEMSLVGPRPELPEYVASYTSQQRKVLTVRPGITDIASVCYRYEEEVLHHSSDPKRFYREIILPHKLALNLEYLEKLTFFYDLYLIFRTLRALFIAPLVERGKAK